jgi:hypothetical protein
MSTLIEIERAIEQLPNDEFRELHRWMSQRDTTAWAAKMDAELEQTVACYAEGDRGTSGALVFDRIRQQLGLQRVEE